MRILVLARASEYLQESTVLPENVYSLGKPPK